MAEAGIESVVLLEELPSSGSEADRVPPFWKAGLARRDPEAQIVWTFRLDPGASLPRGYLESVRQRHTQWAALRGTPEVIKTSFREESGRATEVVVALPDAEVWSDFLRRSPSVVSTGLFLAAELLAWLRTLADSPRLIANVAFTDFLVYHRDGILPSLSFCPVFALIREENPRSDFRIAHDWLELLAGLHAFLKQARKGPLAPMASGDYKPFRSLFRNLESGSDCPLSDRFREFEEFFRSEADLAGKADSPTLPGALADRQARPLGPLARFLQAKALETDPDRFPPSPSPGSASRFSPYAMEALPQNGTARIAHLLPPESWFEHSLVDRLNRRLSHPFLKAHHNCLRVRSVYCDESVTLLATDAAETLPLPTLLGARGGIDGTDLLVIAGKLHRVLAQFDSAEFDPGLVSPWQIELHLENTVSHPGWDHLFAMEITAWPAWEIVLRIEQPTETLLPGASTESFARVRESLNGKFFPALLAWMLDWKRFQWAARSGSLTNEPLSWDERLAALFRAAAEYLNCSSSAQREKFLAWLEEGLASE